MDKKAVLCEFCSNYGCKDCVYKTMPYPVNNPDKSLRGKICKTCEAKFYIKKVLNIIKQSNTIIDNR